MNDITLWFVPTSGSVKCDCCGAKPDVVVLVKHEYMSTRLCEKCVETVKPGMTLREFSARIHAVPLSARV